MAGRGSEGAVRSGAVRTGLADKVLCEQELPSEYMREQVGSAWNFPGTAVWLEQHVQGPCVGMVKRTTELCVKCWD